MALWYVDNALGTGTNAGTSWANAWRTFSAITWASLGPNDTLYISGGSTSQTYTEKLTIGAHTATAGNPLTITPGIDAGHTGIVILDGATSTVMDTANGIIEVYSRTNLVIQNLMLQNTFENCLHITGVASGTVLCQNLTMHTGNGTATLTTNGTTIVGNAVLHFASVPSDIIANPTQYSITDALGKIPGQSWAISATSTSITLNNTIIGSTLASGATITYGVSARGVRFGTNSGGTVTVQNCTIDTPANTVAQTDGVFTAGNTSGATIFFQYNTITINNTNPDGHNDGMQSSVDGGTVNFIGNTVLYPNGGLGNNHCALIGDPAVGATINFFDNVLYMGPHAVSAGSGPDPGAGILLQQLTPTVSEGTANVYNNTFVGGSPNVSYGFAGAGPFATFNVKNNIFYTSTIDSVPVSLTTGNLPTPANHANNLVLADNTSSLRVSCTSTSTGGVRGTTSLSAGTVYFEIQLGYVYSGGHTLFGIANATNSLTAYLGSATNGVGYEWDTGQIYINGSVLATIQLANPGDLIGVAIDFTNSKIWIINWNTNQLWNNAAIGSQNPVGNVGGTSLATLAAGPYFICQTLNGAGSYSVLNAGGSTFGGTMPTGFSAWGAATVWNSSDIVAPATLTSPVAYISNASTTWAAWQAAGYDASGVNANPLFAAPASNNYRLQAGSPAINVGATLSAVTTDRDGVTRPQGARYDIGAYEFAGVIVGARRLVVF